MQTTLAIDEAEEIADVLRTRFPDAARAGRRDDICYATTNRQRAVRQIARDCDLLLVVGSPNSSNSLRLVEVANGRVYRPASSRMRGELDLGRGGRRETDRGDRRRVRTTPAGRGVVVACLAGLGRDSGRETEAEPEDTRFTLPKEVS